MPMLSGEDWRKRNDTEGGRVIETETIRKRTEIDMAGQNQGGGWAIGTVIEIAPNGSISINIGGAAVIITDHPVDHRRIIPTPMPSRAG